MKHAFREQKHPMQTLPDWGENTHFLPKMWPNPCKISKKNYQKKYEKMAFWPLNSYYGLSNALESKTDEEISAYFSDALKVSTGQTQGRKCGLRGHTQRWNHTAYVCVHRATGWTRQAQLPQILWCKKRPFWPTNWFFEQVGHKHGLDRGIKGSKAKHTKIRDYYARVNAVEDLQIEPDADIEFPSPTLVDKAKTYDYGYKVAESVTAQLTKQYESKLKTAAIKFQDKLHEKRPASQLV